MNSNSGSKMRSGMTIGDGEINKALVPDRRIENNFFSTREVIDSKKCTEVFNDKLKEFNNDSNEKTEFLESGITYTNSTNQNALKRLLKTLNEFGLQTPLMMNSYIHGKPMKDRKMKFFVSNTSDCVYLPLVYYSESILDEDYDSINSGRAENQVVFFSEENEYICSKNTQELFLKSKKKNTSISGSTFPFHLYNKLMHFKSPNYLCANVNSNIPFAHTFAVIIELTEGSFFPKKFKVEFLSLTRILWPLNNKLSNSRYYCESFKIGLLQWTLELDDPDLYISLLSSKNDKMKKISSDDLAKRSEEYKLKDINSIISDFDCTFSCCNFDETDDDEFNKKGPDFKNYYDPGFYIYLLPIILPPHIPPTIVSKNGSLNHVLRLKSLDEENFSNSSHNLEAIYNLPMVRTPSSLSNSYLNKLIYVDRVWMNSLNYIITVPSKHVSLGTIHKIDLLLIPLIEGLVVKRIKFKVLEHIKYVSKNLCREYDLDDHCISQNDKSNQKKKKRSIFLSEIKANKKFSSESRDNYPYNEIIINTPNENLLFFCYSSKIINYFKNFERSLNVVPLKFQISLPFLTTKQDKFTQTLPINKTKKIQQKKSTFLENDFFLKDNVKSLNNKNDVLLTNYLDKLILDHENLCIKIDNFQFNNYCLNNETKNGYTSVSKALYPDSNFRHIQITHKLQICFRISKPDVSNQAKMNHYEVILDTPLILSSSKCNETSIHLPKYKEKE